jgi:hypothetical protein
MNKTYIPRWREAHPLNGLPLNTVDRGKRILFLPFLGAGGLLFRVVHLISKTMLQHSMRYR